MWIKVHHATDERLIVIQTECISCLMPPKNNGYNGTLICFAGDENDMLEVTESVDEICEMIGIFVGKGIHGEIY